MSRNQYDNLVTKAYANENLSFGETAYWFFACDETDTSKKELIAEELIADAISKRHLKTIVNFRDDADFNSDYLGSQEQPENDLAYLLLLMLNKLEDNPEQFSSFCDRNELNKVEGKNVVDILRNKASDQINPPDWKQTVANLFSFSKEGLENISSARHAKRIFFPSSLA